jgi:hypothetical protein
LRIQVRPLDFDAELNPKDTWLFGLAAEYCKMQLAEPVDLKKPAKIWIVLDEQDQVIGISGYVLKADIPIFRVTGDNSRRATKALYERMNSFFADNGMVGQEVFLHVSSKERPEQRCPAWKSSLKAVGAIKADRFILVVR